MERFACHTTSLEIPHEQREREGETLHLPDYIPEQMLTQIRPSESRTGNASVDGQDNDRKYVYRNNPIAPKTDAPKMDDTQRNGTGHGESANIKINRMPYLDLNFRPLTHRGTTL